WQFLEGGVWEDFGGSITPVVVGSTGFYRSDSIPSRVKWVIRKGWKRETRSHKAASQTGGSDGDVGDLQMRTPIHSTDG
ncbi:hypothetical protein LEMLEM_LOCUS688, partial [Lemmus lemmus]